MRSEYFQYKGYLGSIQYSIPDMCLYGEILFINDTISYEATTLEELKDEFEASVDDYLETCSAISKEPDKPYSGTFNVRVGPEIHRKAAIAAYVSDRTLNEYVKKALEGAIASRNTEHHHIHEHVVVFREDSRRHREYIKEWSECLWIGQDSSGGVNTWPVPAQEAYL